MSTTIADCTAEIIFGLGFPVYIRKLARRRHWGDSSQPLETRLAVITNQVFEGGKIGKYSFYKAKSDVELHRIAMGMNSNRSSPVEKIEFVGFTQAEVDVFGQVNATIGDTGCDCANNLHVDVKFSNQKLVEFCKKAVQSDRTATILSKAMMKVITATRTCARLHDGTTDCN